MKRKGRALKRDSEVLIDKAAHFYRYGNKLSEQENSKAGLLPTLIVQCKAKDSGEETFDS